MKKKEISLTEIPAHQREKALEKFNIIKPHIFDNYPMNKISKESKVPISTLYRWKKNYESDGLVSLVNQKRSDAGIRKVDEIIYKEIQNIRLKNKRINIATVHRKIIKFCSENQLKPPSYKQVYDIVKEIPQSKIDLIQKEESVYRDKHELIKIRESSYPNEIWQADHTLLDIHILDQKGNINRPWLTIIMDDYSRAISGYNISFDSPNALSTALTLHQAIWTKEDKEWKICGIPEKFYTDHGSDFTSHHMEQVAIDLKINLIYSKVGIPRGRGKVERLFQTINQLFLEELPGYLNNSNDHNLLDFKAFEENLHYFLIHQYNYKSHSVTKYAPIERWNKDNFIPNLPKSLEQLDLLLLEISKSRKVHPDGIHFQGFRYTNTNLSAYVGEHVLIRYNPNDLAEIRVFYRDKFLCTAISPQLSEYTIDMKELERARTNRRKDLKNNSYTNPVSDYLNKEHTHINKEVSSKRTNKLKRYKNE
ncbi:Mu transposase C-terminal domain-containing protein [Macrococcoides caseolyticum]|uniref:Mu transposase C-terminal domain-containing protein n=1 Tax=Macrococcoides caseolyticum TaxID=69966 RepID=UPI0030EB7BC3